MQRAQERGKTPKARGAGRTVCLAFACWSGALFAFALLSGCNALQRGKDAKEGEPLYGEFHPKSFGNAPPPGKTTSSKSGTPAAIPALPAATSTDSPAAIAINDPLIGSRPLGIEGLGAGQPVAAWQGTKLTSGQ